MDPPTTIQPSTLSPACHVQLACDDIIVQCGTLYRSGIDDGGDRMTYLGDVRRNGVRWTRHGQEQMSIRVRTISYRSSETEGRVHGGMRM